MFSSSPKKAFNYLTLEQLEENAQKLESGLVEAYKKKNQEVPEHRVKQMTELEEDFVTIKEFVAREILKAEKELAYQQEHYPELFQDHPFAINPMLDSEKPTNLPVLVDVAKEKAAAELIGSKLVLGANRELKALLKGFIGALNYGYVYNHLDEAAGITKDNQLDSDAEKEVRSLYINFKANAQAAKKRSDDLEAHKQKSIEWLQNVRESERNLKHVEANNVLDVREKSKNEEHYPNYVKFVTTENIKNRKVKEYTPQEVEAIDSKVKQAPLVMKDFQGPKTKESEKSTGGYLERLGSMLWSKTPAPTATVANKTEQTEEQQEVVSNRKSM